MITRELLMEHRAAYVAQKEQLLLNASACQGAIEALDRLIAQMDQEEKDDQSQNSDPGPLPGK